MKFGYVFDQKEQLKQLNLSDFPDKSLLILDDDDPLRGRLARAMEKKGFVVKEAKTVVKDATKSVAGKALAFSPMIFLAWDYYNTGSFIHSCVTCCRDFMWPAAVVVAGYMNASPY